MSTATEENTNAFYPEKLDPITSRTEPREVTNAHIPIEAARAEATEKTRNQQLIKELAFQNEEKETRAAELIVANKELAFQNDEKEDRAAELIVANKELAFQNQEKETRAAELIVANKELAFQNQEKEDRAAELIIANKELAFQNQEKETRAAELIAANKELAFQNEEKENRAAELVAANKDLKDIKYAIDESAIVAIMDAHGRITYVNDKFCAISQYSKEELLGRDGGIIDSRGHPREFIQDLWTTIAGGKTWHGDLQNPAKDNTIYWIDTTIVPLLDSNERPYQYIAVGVDITERRRIDLALAAATERELAVIRNAPDVICTIDADGNFASMNPASIKMWGYEPKELIGGSYLALVVPEDRQKTIDSAASNMSGHELTNFENSYTHKDGSTVDLTWTSHWSESEQLMFSVAHDITERKRMDNLVNRMAAIVESSDDAIISKTMDGIITSWNSSAQRVFGYTFEEMVGRHVSKLLPPELTGDEANILDKINNGERLEHYETERVSKDGRRIPVSLTVSPIKNKDGHIVGVSKIIRDVTERKLAEEKLRNFAVELERSNTELQDFASVASHDLQEPLRKIQAFGDRLRGKCADGLSEDGLLYLERMQDAASRMQFLINDLMTFARVTIMAKPFERVDLQLVAEGVLSDLEMRIECTKGRVQTEDLGTIDADPTQMRQLLQNLIGNALKFGRPGVPPVVKVRGKIDRKPAPEGRAGTCDHYLLTIEDNGIGFEAKYVDRIFKVFQRLHGRSEYEGTGIGLAVCRKITDRHGGTISVESVPEKGTIFTVDLPVNQEERIINEHL